MNGDNLFDYFDEKISNLNHVPYDLSSDDSGYKLILEVPGFSKEQIEITHEDNKLIISGKKDKSKNKFIIKKSIDEFENVFTITNKMDVGNISAEHSDGILEITIPYKEEKMPTKITIK
jgi:HSP20 family protein